MSTDVGDAVEVCVVEGVGEMLVEGVGELETEVDADGDAVEEGEGEGDGPRYFTPQAAGDAAETVYKHSDGSSTTEVKLM